MEGQRNSTFLKDNHIITQSLRNWTGLRSSSDNNTNNNNSSSSTCEDNKSTCKSQDTKDKTPIISSNSSISKSQDNASNLTKEENSSQNRNPNNINSVTAHPDNTTINDPIINPNNPKPCRDPDFKADRKRREPIFNAFGSQISTKKTKRASDLVVDSANSTPSLPLFLKSDPQRVVQEQQQQQQSGNSHNNLQYQIGNHQSSPLVSRMKSGSGLLENYEDLIMLFQKFKSHELELIRNLDSVKLLSASYKRSTGQLMSQIHALEDENSKYCAKFNAFQQISLEYGKRMQSIEARESIYRSKIEELATLIEKMREFKDSHVKEENNLRIEKTKLIQELRLKDEALERNRKNYENEKTRLGSELQGLLEEQTQLKSKSDIESKRLLQVEDEIKTLKMDYEDSVTKCDNLSREILQLKLTIDNQNSELQSLRSETDRLKQLGQRQSNLVKERNDEICLLSNRLEILSRENHDMLKDLEKREQEYLQNQSIMEELHERLNKHQNLLNDHEDLALQYQSLKLNHEENSRKLAFHEENMKSLEKEKDDLKVQLEHERQELTSLKKRNDNCEAKSESHWTETILLQRKKYEQDKVILQNRILSLENELKSQKKVQDEFESTKEDQQDKAKSFLVFEESCILNDFDPVEEVIKVVEKDLQTENLKVEPVEPAPFQVLQGINIREEDVFEMPSMKPNLKRKSLNLGDADHARISPLIRKTKGSSGSCEVGGENTSSNVRPGKFSKKNSGKSKSLKGNRTGFADSVINSKAFWPKAGDSSS